MQMSAGTKEYTIAELNLGVMRRDLLPDLIRKYLGNEESDYRIAVLSGLIPKPLSIAPALIPRLDPIPTPMKGRFCFRPPMGPACHRPAQFVQGFDSWELVAKHKQGSLATAAGRSPPQMADNQFHRPDGLALGMVHDCRGSPACAKLSSAPNGVCGRRLT